MAKQVTPLNNTKISNAKPKEIQYTLSDGGGLELRINPTGSKQWVLKYQKPITKKRTNIGLGAYPALSLADARKERERIKQLLQNNIDPKERKEEETFKAKVELNNTLFLIAKAWFEVKKPTVSEDHAEDIWRSLEKHIMPTLANTAISKITAPLVIETLKPLAEKGSLESVKRVSQRMNEVMAYAVNTGAVHANPLAGIRAAFKKPKKEHLPTLLPKQLPELMEAINYASIKLVTRILIEFQLHTMVRPSEATGARWCEFDLEGRLWVIPAERMKKNREHIVPLSDQVVKLLERIKPISEHREHVFPADRDPKTHANAQTANMALKRMGFAGVLVAHGMRALASTTLNEQGFDADVIESALAHTDKNEVRRAYNRSEYLERRRTLMNWWSEHIEIASKGDAAPRVSLKNLRIA